jgi:hypothetical protein
MDALLHDSDDDDDNENEDEEGFMEAYMVRSSPEFYMYTSITVMDMIIFSYFNHIICII